LKLDAQVLTAPLKHFPERARYLEELGFDTLWTLETQHNPFFPLILSAEHTRTIKLGTSIAVAFPRSPMVLAHIAWDLQEFLGGRFILGLGTQVRPHRAALQRSMGFTRPQIARGHIGPASDLGLLAKQISAQIPG
jgi:alkanesulfonate monooxygenase SsuD/methylene tetrahydromethanopterin reductase-like flavin-dependent oxidoreductase (luciferase family)